MSRTLQLLIQRDPSRDRTEKGIEFEGYDFVWPDGRPVTLGLTAFCKHGQKLLGLGRHLAGASERLIDLVLFPLPDREAPLTRLPGHRVRRLGIQREGRHGRLYFFDGTATTITFDLDRDEASILHWVGLSTLHDGERLWFDLAARPAETAVAIPHTPAPAFNFHSMPTDVLS